MLYEITVDESAVLNALSDEWAWAFVRPTDVLFISPFGNVIVKLFDGSCWRVRPEDLSAEKLADNESQLEGIRSQPDFRQDWEVTAWVGQAEAKLGMLKDNQCYGFKIWPLLNQDYSAENMVIKTVPEWLRASGDIANQIKDVPDGAQIQLVIKHSAKS